MKQETTACPQCQADVTAAVETGVKNCPACGTGIAYLRTRPESAWPGMRSVFFFGPFFLSLLFFRPNEMLVGAVVGLILGLCFLGALAISMRYNRKPVSQTIIAFLIGVGFVVVLLGVFFAGCAIVMSGFRNI